MLDKESELGLNNGQDRVKLRDWQAVGEERIIGVPPTHRQFDDCPYSSGEAVTLGPSIPPPDDLCTPVEYVLHATHDAEFLERLQRAFNTSQYKDALREHKYGCIAVEFRRGFTPEEARNRWEAMARQSRADADASSDSE
ncbi:hypothetical protein LTR86_011164 [Recurvomyces mirabilis]|nr:hypothetical protein LTR86_011164 [Recurvomyces mirabilis]